MSLLTYKVFFFSFSRDPSREALLEHVREHARTDGAPKEPHKPPVNKKSENTPDPADLAYRCGHCNQLSNWKHVIQVKSFIERFPSCLFPTYSVASKVILVINVIKNACQ